MKEGDFMTYIRLNTPDVNSSIRILHAVPNAPNIDSAKSSTKLFKNNSTQQPLADKSTIAISFMY